MEAYKKDLLKLPEQLQGVIKRIGLFKNKPILYGDPNLLKSGQLYCTVFLNQLYQICRFVEANADEYYFEHPDIIPPVNSNSKDDDVSLDTDDPKKPKLINDEITI